LKSEFALKMLLNHSEACYNSYPERGEIRPDGRESVACPLKARDSLIVN